LAVLPPFPTFLVIGVRRNATRWLRFNLDAHPEICAPPFTLDFFADADRMSRLGLRWYREQFTEWDGEPHVGEVSCSYTAYSHQPAEIAARIQRLLPDVRLVAVVGDPTERFYSELHHLVRVGVVPPDVDVDAFFQLMVHQEAAISTVVSGLQGAMLKLYADRFGDQLQVVLMDDVRADPVGTYRSVLRHIGADPEHVPAGLDQVRYSDRHVVELAEPNLEAKRFLYAWYRPDMEVLEEVTGRDLSAWDPGMGPDTPTTEMILAGLKGAV
jgi:hypothetical protein